MKVVAFVPAKGNSERIQNKNLKILDGKPLFLRQIERLLKMDCIDEVYLDTDSDEFIEIASHTGCKILKRDSSLASNATDGNVLFYNEVCQVEADVYIQSLCTSPFISEETYSNGIEILKRNEDYDSVVLIRNQKQYTWNFESKRPDYNLDKIPNSKDLPDTIVETMGMYMVRADSVFKTKRRIGQNPFLLEAKAIEAIDVNYPDDFELANYIAAGIRESERKVFQNLGHILSSAILSDIFDDIGIKNQIISGLILNIAGKKMLGRAKTLKIKKRENSDTTSIYDALLSYDTIVPNDIIVVENECPSFAYFGELNANLAIRAGSIGAIIGGKTRDSSAVRNLDFPVFSAGFGCQDVKHQGTLESMNKPVNIHGVVVNVNDLIFADNEGLVVIPQGIENKVLSLAKDVLKKENHIVNEVAEGIDVNELRRRHGDF